MNKTINASRQTIPQHHTLLYDGQCGICGKFADWLKQQPAEPPIRCLPQQQAAVDPAFASVGFNTDDQGRPNEIVLIESDDSVYRDTDAYLRLLAMLPKTQALAKQLSRPGMRPWVRRAAHAVVNHRDGISKLLGLSSDRQTIKNTLAQTPEPMRCATTNPAPAVKTNRSLP